MFKLKVLAAAVSGLLVVAGCATAPEPPQADEIVLADGFMASGLETEFNDRWWAQFDDPVLSALIDEALAANKSLEVASANVRIAEAMAARARLDGSYSTGTLAGAELGRAAREGADVTLSGDASLGASWELDAFGRIGAQIEAAEFDVEAARQARRDVAVIIASQTALNYIELRGAQRRLEVTRSNAGTQAEGLELLQTLLDNGRATQLDLDRAEAQYRTTLALQPVYEAIIQSSQSALAALTGRPANAPGEMIGGLSADPVDIPEHGGAILTGSVEEMVRRRPDIRQAEAVIASQLALGEAARADLFPRITFNANLFALFDDNSNSDDFSSFGFGVGPAISWAGPDLRGVRANIDIADAQSEAAMARYEDTVINALSEVEAALSDYASELRRRDNLQKAVISARRALDLARLRFEEGVDDYLDVLEAQRTLLDAEDRLAESRLQSSRRAIAAYRALGGVEFDETGGHSGG